MDKNKCKSSCRAELFKFRTVINSELQKPNIQADQQTRIRESPWPSGRAPLAGVTLIEIYFSARHWTGIFITIHCDLFSTPLSFVRSLGINNEMCKQWPHPPKPPQGHGEKRWKIFLSVRRWIMTNDALLNFTGQLQNYLVQQWSPQRSVWYGRFWCCWPRFPPCTLSGH